MINNFLFENSGNNIFKLNDTSHMESVKVYRGVRGGTNPTKPRNGYQLSFSTRKAVADSYLDDISDESQEFELRFSENDLIEFPTKNGNFSKVGFDTTVRDNPDKIVRASGVYDIGPFASRERDPEMLYSYSSDIYGTMNPRFVGN